MSFNAYWDANPIDVPFIGILNCAYGSDGLICFRETDTLARWRVKANPSNLGTASIGSYPITLTLTTSGGTVLTRTFTLHVECNVSAIA